MRDDRTTPQELDDFAARLAALPPRAVVNRDQLMFAAGWQAGARRVRVLRSCLALTSAACVALTAALVTVPRGEIKTADAPSAKPPGASQVEVVQTPTEPEPRGALAYLVLQSRLAANLDARLDEPRSAGEAGGLGNASVRAPKSSSARALLNDFLSGNAERL